MTKGRDMENLLSKAVAYLGGIKANGVRKISDQGDWMKRNPVKIQR